MLVGPHRAEGVPANDCGCGFDVPSLQSYVLHTCEVFCACDVIEEIDVVGHTTRASEEVQCGCSFAKKG